MVAGDYNNDGSVNAADYTRWRDNLDAAEGTLPNDTDGGIIGQAQYITWKENFGRVAGTTGGGSQQILGVVEYSTLPVGSGSGATAAVPDPSTIIHLGLGLLAALTVIHRRT